MLAATLPASDGADLAVRRRHPDQPGSASAVALGMEALLLKLRPSVRWPAIGSALVTAVLLALALPPLRALVADADCGGQRHRLSAQFQVVKLFETRPGKP